MQEQSSLSPLRQTNMNTTIQSPADLKPEAVNDLIAALRAIAASAGNLPDERLESRTGANDAVARGLMVTSMRSIAVKALNKHRLGLPDILTI